MLSADLPFVAGEETLGFDPPSVNATWTLLWRDVRRGGTYRGGMAWVILPARLSGFALWNQEAAAGVF